MAETQNPEIQMESGDMFREDIFTDNLIGTIRMLTPVTAAGEPDNDRSIRYIGSTQIMTPAGALPLTFPIEADGLAAAIEAFGTEAEKALERTMEELKELQRQAASQIVVPKSGMDPTGGMPGGGIPGGGIQMP